MVMESSVGMTYVLRSRYCGSSCGQRDQSMQCIVGHRHDRWSCSMMLLQSWALPQSPFITYAFPLLCRDGHFFILLPLIYLMSWDIVVSGTDINSLDQSGRTPLHLAIGHLHLLHQDCEFSSEQLKAAVAQVSWSSLCDVALLLNVADEFWSLVSYLLLSCPQVS